MPGAPESRGRLLSRPHPAALLLDIEGTTTPIAFVYDVLFPLARRRLEGFLTALSASELEALVASVRAEHEQDAEAPAWGPADPRAAVEAYLTWLMDRDRKSTVLKAVQGRIWEQGFRTGEVQGAVYPDVKPALERWTGEGRRVAIFSSGSVLAQRLLFGHSALGDLTGHISAFFDTTTGPKREAGSYRAIAAALGEAPADVLFVSDVVAELDAARVAGLGTRLCVRDGDPTQAELGGHVVVRDFAGWP